ncbi:hypothetical protein [Thiothrix nivea]|uniref:hypothetical protein n=1 Tax=Thiothrix nivea TaxID=1031 RepID=UPI000594018C|nr:hypothetical protein [Thiothrix nivea]
MIQQTANECAKSFDFSDLTASAINAQTIAVRRNYGQTAKSGGYHPLTWRQHRHLLHGGFFSPVEYGNGFMPGVRGLQDGENRSKREVFQESLDSVRQFLPTIKTQLGAVIMTAITHPMGNPARRASAHLTVGGVA